MKNEEAGAQPILSARGLIKLFPQGDQEIEILHGIDLDLRAGEIVAVLGPSGAGKSTLLHSLGLMEQPSAGILKIEGQEVQVALAEKTRAAAQQSTSAFSSSFIIFCLN